MHETRWTGRCALVSDPINLQRPHHILKFHLAYPLHRFGNAILDLVEDLPGDTNAACSGQWFDTSGDVDSIPNHIVIAPHNIASMNSDTHLE